MNWLTDPKTGQKSVSLTLLVSASVLMVIFIFVEAFTSMQSTELINQYFYATIGLYFGRKSISFGGKTFGLGETDKPEEK